MVELGDTAVRELGVQWLLAGSDGTPIGLTNYSDRAAPLAPLAGGAAAGQLDKDDPLREQLQNLALNSLVGANGFIGGGGGRIGSDGLFGFIINAAKSDEGSNLLQTPSLMTLDNEEATILVGQEVPIDLVEAVAEAPEDAPPESVRLARRAREILLQVTEVLAPPPEPVRTMETTQAA